MGLREELDAMDEARSMGRLREYLNGTMSDEDRVRLRDYFNAPPTDPSATPTASDYAWMRARGD